MIKEYSKEIKIISVIFIFKLIILSFIPLTGDEAYFIKWATHLSSGYYDHPPMVGWLIYLMSFVNDNYVFFRLLSVVTTFIVAFVIYEIGALYIDKKRAFFIALLFLASPIDILLSLFTNDVALLLFGSLGTLFLLYSFHKRRGVLFAALGGIFLGFAFLSKYFAVFLMFSLLIFIIIRYRNFKALKNVLVASNFIFIAIAQNLYFNYNSCWNNIMFNFFIRTESHYNFESVTNYFIMLIYLFTPWAIYFLFKDRRLFVMNDLMKLVISILSIVFGIYFIVSLKNELGLHWFILFVPYMFLLFSYLSIERLQKLFKYNALFTFIHIAILVTALLLPISLFKDAKYYSDIVYAYYPEKICSKIEEYSDDEIFTVGYTTSSMLSYACKRDIKMLFSNSKFGRYDDKLLDIRELDKKDLYLFDNREITKNSFDNVCKSVDVEIFKIKGADFYLAKCSGFDYEKYKSSYLDFQKKRYYDIPKWLPVGKCYFLDRYYK